MKQSFRRDQELAKGWGQIVHPLVVCTSYRYDFFGDPNKFREMMMQGKIAACLSDRRQGRSNLLDHFPILSFKNEKEDGVYLHFYCIEDIVQRR